MICTWSNAVEHLKLFDINIHFHSSAYKLFSLWNCILSSCLITSIIIIASWMGKLLFHARSLIITIRIRWNARNVAWIIALAITSNSMITVFSTLRSINLLCLRNVFRFDLSIIFFGSFTMFFNLFFSRLGFGFYFYHMSLN